MKLLLTTFLMILLLNPVNAKADMDVTCLGGDCLSHGWDIFDQFNGQRGRVMCSKEKSHTGGCLQDGWKYAQNSRILSHVECLPGGCFNEGWIEYDMFTGEYVAEGRCFVDEDGWGDCLSIGWKINIRNGNEFHTHCRDEDCRKWGWNVYVNRREVQTVRCKKNGCFRQGWTLFNKQYISPNNYLLKNYF